MSYFNIDKINTIIEAQKVMEHEWLSISFCSTTATRKTIYTHMKALYKKFPELSTWWDYDPKATRYTDAFTKHQQKKKSYCPVTGELPQLEIPCADISWLPESKGLYFIGMIGINPNGTKYYLVKVGATENIAKRIRQYGTYNPMLYIGGVALDIRKQLSDAETTCHEYLAEKAYAYAKNAREWFYVDEATYFELCETFADKEMFRAIAEGRD